MNFIGILFIRLKKITQPLGAYILMVFMMFSAPTLALDRDLASTEIEKLESNVRKDPQNKASAKFLIQHYFNKQQWKDLVRVAQPQQKALESSVAMMLVEGYLALQDGQSANALLGHIQSSSGVTADTKMWEARALVIMARGEKTAIQKMNHANKSIEVIRAAAELDPKNEDVYLEWVDILREFWPHLAQDALNVVNVMEQKLDDYESHIPLKCDLYAKAALWDQGAVACQRAIRTNGKDVNSRLNYAEVLNIKEGPEARKKSLIKIAKDHPGHFEAQVLLGDVYFADQDFIGATAQYKKAIELRKADTAVLLKLAQSEFKIKQFATALQSYRAHCKQARMVSSEFKDATKQIRSDKKLHRQYEEAMLTCR